MLDELNEPLGLLSGALAAPPIGRARVSGRVAAAAAIVAAIGLFALARRDAPLGGQPFAVAKVEVLPASPKPAAPAVSAGAHEPTAPPVASAAQVEAISGVEVTRGSGGGAPKGLIIDVARALAADHASTPDHRLVEKPQQGLSPRAGADGDAPAPTPATQNPLAPSNR